MKVTIKNTQTKYKNEIELQKMMIEIINQIVEDCKNLEIIYEYGYTPLNDKIKGVCRYDNNELKFECDEFLNDLKIIFKKEKV